MRLLHQAARLAAFFTARTATMAASAQPRHIWSKICGITNPADAEWAAAHGVDAIGLNFSPASARRVDAAAAVEILQSVRCTRVALFVDPRQAEVDAVLQQGGIDMLQFHGRESAEFCRSFGMPYMKALRVRGDTDLAALDAAYGDAWALLLDAYVEGQTGGTGQTFDWRLWPRQLERPGVLAGGLTPDNVAQAIRCTRPFGVDVAGGVEGADKRRKDQQKVADFLAVVKRMETELT